MTGVARYQDEKKVGSGVCSNVPKIAIQINIKCKSRNKSWFGTSKVTLSRAYKTNKTFL